MMFSRAEASGELGWMRKSGNKIWGKREGVHTCVVKV